MTRSDPSSGPVLCLLQREPESRARSTFLRMMANIDAIRSVTPTVEVVCLAKDKGVNKERIQYLKTGLRGFADLKKGFLGTVTEVFGKNLFEGIRKVQAHIHRAGTVVYLEAYGNLPYLILARLQHKRTICDFQNCESELGLSIATNGTLFSRVVGFGWMVYGWLAEELFLRLSDMVVVPSDHDKESLEKFHRPSRASIRVIPNMLPTPPGVSSPDQPADGSVNVLFLNSADYRPNWDACLYIINELAPGLEHLERMKFILAGAKTEELRPKSRNVQILGYVKDLDPLLKSVQVGISPVFSGAGTSYKVLMYYCAGLVVIGSVRSMRGVDPRLKNGIPLARTPEEFPPILEDMYNHPGKYSQLAAERVGLARDLYTVGPRFVETWRTALAGEASVASAAETPPLSERI